MCLYQAKQKLFILPVFHITSTGSSTQGQRHSGEYSAYGPEGGPGDLQVP